MQGIENITGRIESDAQAEIDLIRADADREAEKIAASYAARAEQETADILAKGEKGATERGDRLVSAAKMDAQKMILAAKQEMLDRAFDLALEQMIQMPEEDYVALLARLAASAAGTGTETVILNAADRRKLGGAVVKQANALLSAAGKRGDLTLSDQTRPIQGGLLVSDGAVEVNCALETLVRLSRSETAGEVGKLLFA